MTKNKDSKQHEEHEPKQDKHHAKEAQTEKTPAAETAPDFFEQLVRLKAEFENYRKRTEREKPQLIAFGANNVLASFLPLYDTMLKAEEMSNNKDASYKGVKEGLDLVFKEMKKVFESNGVRPMSVIGKTYDPMSHEVLTTLPCKSDSEDGLVIEEVQKGFTIGDNILRHAKVCVGKFEDTPGDAPAAEKDAEPQ